jgi:RNA polymerase sigma-70 factor (ECF subfamily)
MRGTVFGIDYRSALVLFDIEGFSYDDIVKIMACPLGTVCSRIHKARQLLKQALLENNPEVTAVYE